MQLTPVIALTVLLLALPLPAMAQDATPATASSAASGDFDAFFPMLFDSIRSVSGTNGGVDPGGQLNQYVRPTASQLASGRAVFHARGGIDIARGMVQHFRHVGCECVGFSVG